MSAKTNKRPLRSLTAHEKLDAIRRVHDGESKASVARDIGVPESTLRGWCKNEDKISYLSRQSSSPDTDESLEHSQSKKPKLEEPFNLCLKSGGATSGGTYSPNSALDYTKKTKNEVECKTPSNPNKAEKPKSAAPVSERERNRAELARLSVELGLNRQEFVPGLTANSDLTANIGILAQWNALLMQHQQLNAMQTSKINKVTAPADTSGLVSPSTGLLTTVDQEKARQLQLLKEQHPSPESVWNWVRTQQSMMDTSTSAAPGINGMFSGSSPPTTTAAAIPPALGLNGMAADQSSWIWKWYQQLAYTPPGQPPVQPPEPVLDTKPILYQQLTKDLPIPAHQQSVSPTLRTPADQQNAENLSMRDERHRLAEKSNNKARSVLDNLLFHNNNNVVSNKKDENLEEGSSQNEAVVHGEKFLKWLESYSDPNVTAMHIMQFRVLLNNVKTGADRKNKDVQNKAKVKRK